jgi:hypothetical protein
LQASLHLGAGRFKMRCLQQSFTLGLVGF